MSDADAFCPDSGAMEGSGGSCGARRPVPLLRCAMMREEEEAETGGVLDAGAEQSSAGAGARASAV
eukprot:3711005-Rhodomonas_salina.2